MAVAIEVGGGRHLPVGVDGLVGAGDDVADLGGAVHGPDHELLGGDVAPEDVGPAVGVEIAGGRELPVGRQRRRSGDHVRADHGGPRGGVTADDLVDVVAVEVVDAGGVPRGGPSGGGEVDRDDRLGLPPRGLGAPGPRRAGRGLGEQRGQAQAPRVALDVASRHVEEGGDRKEPALSRRQGDGTELEGRRRIARSYRRARVVQGRDGRVRQLAEERLPDAHLVVARLVGAVGEQAGAVDELDEPGRQRCGHVARGRRGQVGVEVVEQGDLGRRGIVVLDRDAADEAARRALAVQQQDLLRDVEAAPGEVPPVGLDLAREVELAGGG